MGKRGPKPTPTQLLKLGGSWRAGLNPGEPPVERGFPETPDDFTDKEIALWQSLSQMLYDAKLLSPMDGMALADLVRARIEQLDADAKIRRTGMLVKDRHGQLRLNPLFAVRDAAAKRVKDLLAAFGMTPADRARVSVVPDRPMKEAQKVDEIFDT